VDKYIELEISLDEGDYFRPLCGLKMWICRLIQDASSRLCTAADVISEKFSLTILTILSTKTIHSPTGPKICDESYEFICIRISILIPFNSGKRELSGEKGKILL
jgi:hypothetical protein